MKITGKKLATLAMALERALADVHSDLGLSVGSDDVSEILQDQADLEALQSRTLVLLDREAGKARAEKS